MEMFTVDDDVAQWEAGPACPARHGPPATAAAAGLAPAPARHRARRAHWPTKRWPCCPAPLDDRRRARRRGAPACWCDGRSGVAVRRTRRGARHWPSEALLPASPRWATMPAAPTPTGCAPGSRSTMATTLNSDAELGAPPPRRRATAGDTRTPMRGRRGQRALGRVARPATRAEARWGDRFNSGDGTRHPALASWINDYLGTGRHPGSDFGARRRLLHALPTKRRWTPARCARAINVATNIGNGFTSLNAHHAALEWMQRGLDLARPTGWPLSIGAVPDADRRNAAPAGPARSRARMLRRGAGHPGSRCPARAPTPSRCEYQGDLALDSGDYDGALDELRAPGRARRSARPGRLPERRAARPGACAVAPGPAARSAGHGADALALAREHGDAYNQIAALRVLADDPRAATRCRRRPA